MYLFFVIVFIIEKYLVLDEWSSNIPPPEVSSCNSNKQNCDNVSIPISLEEKLLKVFLSY